MAGNETRHTLKLGFEGSFKKVAVNTPKDEPRPWDADTKTRVVGKAVPRMDGHLKASGAAKYTHDINLPDMQHAAVLRSPHACAVIKSIDTKAAESAAGVSA